VIDAITWIKKYDCNRSIRKRSSDFHVAKYLMDAASSKSSDQSLTIRKGYMFTVIAFLEGNVIKTNGISSRLGKSELEEAQISTITDAVQAWRNTGDNEKAKAFLKLSQEKLKNIDNGNEKKVLGMLVAKSEDAIGEKRPQAL
jgi:hypothetical protein